MSVKRTLDITIATDRFRQVPDGKYSDTSFLSFGFSGLTASVIESAILPHVSQPFLAAVSSTLIFACIWFAGGSCFDCRSLRLIFRWDMADFEQALLL